MSGLQIVGFLLGTTGPIEKCIHIAQSFYQHCQNFRQNATTIQNLIQMLQQTREHLEKLQTRINEIQSHLPQHGMQVFNTTMSQVQLDLANAYRSLEDMKAVSEKKGPKHFFKATNIARKYEDLLQLIQKTNESLVQFNSPITGIEATMSITDSQTRKVGNLISSVTDAQTKEIKGLLENKNYPTDPPTERTSSIDVFKPQFPFQNYNRAAEPNFRMDNDSIPLTIEAQVKQHLLINTQAGCRTIAIQGEAGVGKTTTLHMLPFDPEIRNHFEHGIYYMRLGADASTDTAIQQLRQIARSSGGVTLSADTGKWSNVSSAIETTAQWFKDKTFLNLIDDVWDTPAIPSILEDILSQVVLASPHAAAVYTTRNQDIATVDTTEMVLQLRRKGSESRESRHLLLRYARYPKDSTFDTKDEAAISYILKETAGLPAAHSVSGRAIAKYKFERNKGISPWVWYMHTHNSILKSSSGRYDSLQVIFSTSLRTLEVKNANSSSPDLRNFYTEDYMRMYRSLCVFQKQQWILIPVLVRLWSLDESVVRSVLEEFLKVGLVERCDKELEDERIVEGIMIHDLLHDFATEEATNHETVQNWHHQLVNKYAEDLKVSPSGKCYTWWKLKDTDHGYVMKNLFRHFLGSECKEIKMKHIVSRPEWIQSQLVMNGINQYETDVSLATKQEKEKDAPDDDEMNNMTLERILDATKLSYSYILSNPDEVWVQLYDRLMSLEECCCVKEYLQEIEENAPRPWLKPLSRYLTTAGGGMHQLFYVKEGIICTAVVPGKHELVCGCDDGWIRVVDLEELEVKRKWKGHDGQVSAICVSSRGRFIVSGRDGTVKLWDCENGRQMGETNSDHNLLIRAVTMSRDERTAYILSSYGLVESWVIATGMKGIVLRPTFALHNSSYDLHVLADDNLIFGFNPVSHHSTTGVPQVMKILIPNVGEDKTHTGLNQTWHEIRSSHIVDYRSEEGPRIGHERGFKCAFDFTILKEQKFIIAISEDGTKLLTQQYDGNFIIWNGTSMMRIGFIQQISQLYRRASGAVSNGSDIALLDRGSVTIYEASTTDPDRTYQNVGKYTLELSRINGGLQFVGDESKVLANTENGLIRVLRNETLEIENERRMQKMSAVTAVTQTPDEKYFVTGHGDGETHLWDTCTGEQSGTCLTSPHGGCIKKIKVSENGEWVVSVEDLSLVSVSNLQNRKLKKSFRIDKMYEHYHVRLDVDVSSDGTLVVVMPQIGYSIGLWDISKTKQLPLVSPPSLVIDDTRILGDYLSFHRGLYWGSNIDVWFRNGTNCIVSVGEKVIEEWVLSYGKYVKSRKFPTSYYPMSKEDVFKVLNNSDSQVPLVVEEPNRFCVSENKILYGRPTSCKILAMLESPSTGYSYCSMSNMLCVGSRTGPRFFRFYPAT